MKPTAARKKNLPALLALAALALLWTALPPSAEAVERARPRLLSAAHEMDDKPVPWSNLWTRLLCAKAGRMDRIALVFTHEIEESSLDPEDFAITTRSGVKKTPFCLTTSPSDEENEDRTIFLLGDFGSAVFDPPLKARVVGSLTTEPNLDNVIYDMRGLSYDGVALLDEAPSLVYAELIAPAERESGGSDCPSAAKAALRLTWSRAVSDPQDWSATFVNMRGDSAAAAEAGAAAAGAAAGSSDGPFDAAPSAIGDRLDEDNNTNLCLSVAGSPLTVRVPKGFVKSARGLPNREEEVLVHRAR